MNTARAIADAPGTPMVLQLAPVTPRRWQDAALCAQVGPGIFFPEKGESVRAPKQVCKLCPVRAECLDYALEHDERFGIWGGTSEWERRGLRRQRRAS